MDNEIIILPEKYYSAKGVVDLKVLHWASRWTFTKKLGEKEWIDIFNPIVENHGKTRRFYIKGEYIIKYLNSLKKKVNQ